MNKLESWEEEYKRKANQKSVSPPEFVWDNVEKAIAKPKKKRRIFLWLFLFLPLFFAIKYIITLDKNDAITHNSADHATVENPTLVSNEQSTLNNQKEGHSNLKETEEINFNLIENSSTTESSAVPSSIQETEIISANNTLLNTIYTSTSDNTSSNSFDKIKNVKSYMDLLYKKNSTSTYALANNQLEVFTEAKSDLIGVNSNEIAVLPISITNQYTLFEKQLQALDNLKVFKEQQDYQQFKKYFVQVEFNVGKPIRFIEQTQDQEHAFSRLASSTTPWYAYGGSITLGRVLPSGLYFTSGIDFLQIKEKFHVELNGISQKNTVFDPNTGSLLGSKIVTGTYINKGENRISMLNVPLLLGYRKSYSTWQFSGELGTVINIATSFQGKELKPLNEVERIDQSQSILKTNVGTSIQGSLVIGKSIGHNTIFARTHYRHSFQNWYKTSDILLRYSNFQIGVGLQHYF